MPVPEANQTLLETSPMMTTRGVSLCIIMLLALSAAQPALARKTNQAVYREPFDLAAGGTSLTRASAQGILFANPALLPLGAAYIRLLGSQLGIIANQKAISSGQQLSGQSPGEILDTVLTTPYHVGQSFSLSFLNKNVGFSAFSQISLDIEGGRFDDGGLPAIQVEGEGYGGAALSLAARPFRWLLLGATSKYIGVSEPSLLVPLIDTERVNAVLSDPNSLSSALSYGYGLGMDAGMLLFSQGKTFDFSLALKADDIGNTNLTGRDPFKQTYHAGLGFAIHGSTEVLHLALDYRDVTNAYEEKPFKKLHLGARLMLRQMIGIAAGYYQGLPTYGVRLDLIFLKLGITSYGREFGDFPGDRPRQLIFTYLSFGF